MTAEEVKQARLSLGLTLDEFAKLIRVSSGRTVRKWENNEREVPGPVSVLMDLFLHCPESWKCRCAMEDMREAFACRCSSQTKNITH
jgi:DNA-binding transcriptional regulator YiaG